MTKVEKSRLEEIEKRLAELEAKKISYVAWQQVKKSVDLSHIENPYRSRLESAASKIVCTRMKIRRLANLTDEQVEKAIEVYKQALRTAGVII